MLVSQSGSSSEDSLRTQSAHSFPSSDSSEPSPSIPSSAEALHDTPDELIDTDDEGALPAGATVFDDKYAGIANLDPALLVAIRKAATEATAESVEFVLTSGWRSKSYQNQLLDEAISEYGSVAEAARWVATADTSPHVSGDAIDVGSSDAITWLSEHGAAYGLCQIYANEPWHYELRPEAKERGCPSMYADPTHDPRMQ